MENKEKAMKEGAVTAKELEAAMPVSEPVAPILEIKRAAFTTNDGKKYYSYFVEGEIRGRKIRVDFEAKDKGGYEVLDIIFDIKPTASLSITEEFMENDKTGEKVPYQIYEVFNVDEDGLIYSYAVKPSQASDKALLRMLLQQKK